MQKPPVPLNEKFRLEALDSYEILDTPEEAVYDAFTRLAREIAGTKMSAISLVDRDRQWFKSTAGFEATETPREVSLCAHVVAEGGPVVIRDAHLDARFVNHPAVTDGFQVRFYAGLPLRNHDGFTLGSLCVFDEEPHEITSQQVAALEELSRVLIGVMEGRRRFLHLFASAGIDVLTVDPKDHTIVFASRGACERLQYDPKELIGKSLFEIAPVTPEQARKIDDRARAGEVVTFESRFQRSDGSWYPVEVRIDRTSEHGEERMLMIASDLTRRKEQEREIMLLLGAINVAGDVILVYRVSEDRSLQLAYMNDAYKVQTGYTPAEAIGKTLEDFRHDMPDDEGMARIRVAMQDGVPAQEEIVSYRKDGSTYWNQVTLHPVIGASGSVTHWIAIERDITEEVQRKATFAEEHDRLLALTRAARRLFTVLDTRSLNATIRDVVRGLIPAHARVLAAQDGRAIEVQELSCNDWSDAFSDDLVEQAVRYKMRVVDEEQQRAVAYVGHFGDAHCLLELRPRSSLTLRNTELFVFDLITEYFAVAARNVTLYKELEDRRSAVLELSQNKSDLIAMLAHDFRGPLTSIVGFADLTSEVGDVNEEQLEFLKTIKQSAMQLSNLATDTLTLSRLERNEVTLRVNEVDLAGLLREVIAQHADGREIALHVDGDAALTGDEERLRQVFANVIDNAVKYSPGGVSPEVSVTGDANTVTVCVRDFGIGIPAGELNRVFDRFARASNARKMRISGTGFGLFLTKQLVQLHAGEISVESREGEGSTFTIRLPRRVERGAGPRTVVVIDQERDRSFLTYGVREAGYRVIAAGTLDEVLCATDAQNIDALIVSAPETLASADAALYRAFAQERGIPIVAISNEPSLIFRPAVTLPRPVLIGDVVSALESLRVDPTR